MSKPDELFANRLTPDMADLAAYRFVRFIAQRDARRFQTLLKSLREGEEFSDAFQLLRTRPPPNNWLRAGFKRTLVAFAVVRVKTSQA
jgi:hypothetical protein